MMKQAGWIALGMLLFAASAVAQPRVDFGNPVFRGDLRVVVDHAYPNTDIQLTIALEGPDGNPDPTSQRLLAPGRTDHSGTLRFELPIAAEAGWLEGGVILTATDAPGDPSRLSAPVTVRVAAKPTMLVTGVEPGGDAYLYEWAVGDDAPSFALRLGNGVPGGAVRDGRHQSIYVIADAEQGIVQRVRRSPSGDDTVEVRFLEEIRSLDLRDIVATADGRRVLVSAAGAGDSRLFVIDTRTEQVREIAIESLGPNGGRIAVSEDGLSAFVVVRGLYIRQINLLHLMPGHRIVVGDPAQTEVRDLRIVEGNLFALTGRPADAAPSDSVTGLETANLHHVEQLSRLVAAAHLGVGAVAEPDGLAPAVLALEGGEGSVTVIDAQTMRRRFDFDVPVGADALLFSPDPTHTQVALLYGERRADAHIRWIDLAVDGGPIIGEPQDVGFPARSLPVRGTSPYIHQVTVYDDTDRAWLVSDPVIPQPIPLPEGVRVVAVSVQ